MLALVRDFLSHSFTCTHGHSYDPSDPLFILIAERNGSRFGWFLTLLVLAAVVAAGFAGYIFYKYRLRVCIRSTDFTCCFTLYHYISICICTCSLTWTRRSWLSCRSTCRWTISVTSKLLVTHSLCDKAQQHKRG